MMTKNEEEYEIQIPCDCHTEKMIIHKFDDSEDYFYLAFWHSTFYDQSLINTLKERIQMAWDSLWKGTFIHQELTLNIAKIIELRDDLNKIIEISSTKRIKCHYCKINYPLEYNPGWGWFHHNLDGGPDLRCEDLEVQERPNPDDLKKEPPPQKYREDDEIMG